MLLFSSRSEKTVIFCTIFALNRLLFLRNLNVEVTAIILSNLNTERAYKRLSHAPNLSYLTETQNGSCTRLFSR